MLTELLELRKELTLEIGNYSIRCGDSMEIMKSIESASVDCVITDPPYAGFGFGNTPKDYIDGLLPFVSEMLRCTKGEMDSKRFAISQPGRKMDLLSQRIPPTNYLRIPDAFADGRGDDAVFLLRNPVDMTQATEGSWTELPDSEHPNHRNVNKMAPLITVMTKIGDTILDPFCGSAAIGLAAVLLGRNYIGIELGENRATEADLRLAAVGASGLAI